MTFEEFLKYVRKHIGNYCTDKYWEWKYSTLKETTPEFIKKETPFLAVMAIGIDHATKHADRIFDVKH